MPGYVYVGRYMGYAVRLPHSQGESNRYESRRASSSDSRAITEFLNLNGKNKAFCPLITIDDIGSGKYPGLAIDDFTLMSDRSGKLVAAGALWDQSAYKQYVVQGYNGWLRFLKPFSGALQLFGYPMLPNIGSIIDFKTLSFWSVEKDNPSMFQEFLYCLGSNTCGCAFVVVGVDDKNNLRETLQRRSIVRYASRLYIVDFEKNGKARDLAKSISNCYLEYGLL